MWLCDAFQMRDLSFGSSVGFCRFGDDDVDGGGEGDGGWLKGDGIMHLASLFSMRLALTESHVKPYRDTQSQSRKHFRFRACV